MKYKNIILLFYGQQNSTEYIDIQVIKNRLFHWSFAQNLYILMTQKIFPIPEVYKESIKMKGKKIPSKNKMEKINVYFSVLNFASFLTFCHWIIKVSS